MAGNLLDVLMHGNATDILLNRLGDQLLLFEKKR